CVWPAGWVCAGAGGVATPLPPAVFGVLTGALRAADKLYPCTMSRARFACQSREMFRAIALTGLAALLAGATIPLALPAQAQIGNIFSDPAPRPPGNIPRGAQPPP